MSAIKDQVIDAMNDKAQRKNVIKIALGIALSLSIIVLLLYGYFTELTRANKYERELGKAQEELVNVNALKDSTIKMIRDSFIAKIYDADVRLTEQDALIALAGKEADHWKHMYSVTKLQLRFIRDSIHAGYIGKPLFRPYPSAPPDSAWLRVPQAFGYSDNWTSFTGMIGFKGVGIYGLHINAGELTLIPGIRKRGFFRRSELVYQVTSDCPYLVIPSIKNAVQKPPKRAWYDSRLAWLLYGAAAKTVIDFGISAGGMPK